MFDLNQLQEEMKVWQAYNFPDRPSWIPLMGIVEELGELSSSRMLEDVIDAVSDTIIFMADYLNSTVIDTQTVFDGSGMYVASTTECIILGYQAIGRLYHAHIKQFQQIRTEENQTEIAYDAIKDFFAAMKGYCDNYKLQFDLMTELEKTWNKVKQRDWIKYPKNGRTE